METALCTINSQRYTAIEFARLGPEQIAALRHDLVCTECGGPGYFRKASRSGHGACFGARPHSDECPLAARSDDPWGEAGDEVVQRLEADETRIVLSLGAARGEGDAAQAAGNGPRGHGGARFVGGDVPHRTQIRRNPEKLLRMLVASERFRESGIVIATPDRDVAARDFFVPMEAASRDRNVGTMGAFWGRPIHTNVWMGVRIFNAGPRGSLGVELTNDLCAAIVTRYRLGEITDLQQKIVMFIGTPRITLRNSYMMTVADINRVAVIDPV